MSKDDYETYAVAIGHRDGKRYAERRPLNVPFDLASGNLERLSDLQVREHLNDLIAEQLRRDEVEAAQAVVAEKCNGYDPFQSQFKGVS